MIIDIDIKIADGEGKTIHRYEKHFDERIDSKDVIDDIGKSFEDFLSEYMSFHGRMIREKLINETKCHSHPLAMVTKHEKDVIYDEDLQKINDNNTGEDDSDTYRDSEMEYRIRIGNKRLLTGRIPFRNMNYKNTMIEKQSGSTINETDHNMIENDFKNNIMKQYNSEAMESNKGQNASIKEINRQFNSLLRKKNKTDINIIISYAMMKAIEKYEANLSPLIYDADAGEVENDESYPTTN